MKAKRCIVIAVCILLITIYVMVTYNTTTSKLTGNQNKITQLTNTVESLEHKYKQIDSLPVNRAVYFDLYDKYTAVKNETINLKAGLIEVKQQWIFSWYSFWTTFGAVIGILLAFFGLKNVVEGELVKKLALVLGKNKNDIRDNYNQFIKHQNLKQNSEILILNKKGSSFSLGFKNVMRLYDMDIEKNTINITDLEDIISSSRIRRRIENAAVLIVENQSSNWPIFKKDKEKKDKEIERNLKNLVEIANLTCKTTGLMYYGLGNFPSTKVDKNVRHLITYANVPAALYGNLLDLLKFKMELNN